MLYSQFVRNIRWLFITMTSSTKFSSKGATWWRVQRFFPDVNKRVEKNGGILMYKFEGEQIHILDRRIAKNVRNSEFKYFTIFLNDLQRIQDTPVNECKQETLWYRTRSNVKPVQPTTVADVIDLFRCKTVKCFFPSKMGTADHCHGITEKSSPDADVQA